MSTHKYKPKGTVAVRTYDGSRTVTEYTYPPLPGHGKHYNPNKSHKSKSKRMT